MVGLGDLEGLFQHRGFCDSVLLHRLSQLHGKNATYTCAHMAMGVHVNNLND